MISAIMQATNRKREALPETPADVLTLLEAPVAAPPSLASRPAISSEILCREPT